MNPLQWRAHYRKHMGIGTLVKYFEHRRDEIEKAVANVLKQYPEASIEEATGRALARLDALVFHSVKIEKVEKAAKDYRYELRAIIVLLAFLLISHFVHCQTTGVRGIAKGTTPANTATVTVGDANHNGIDVICVSGCAGSSGSTTPSNAFSNPTTAGMAMSFNAMWNGSTWDLVKGDTTSGLWVNCKNGCAGGTSTPSNAFANPTTAGLSQSFNMMWNGATWDLVKGDTTNGLWVNCKNGCAGGSSTPSDAFANPTTAGLSQGFTMMWNGTTWDRVKGDTTNGMWVNVKSSALPSGAALDASLTTIDTDLKANITLHAGTNVIGHVIADSGSTTAVTGNVASTVADGANVTLGAKADAKSTATDTTAVTVMQVLKEISAMEQAPASRAVTNAGTFATQSTLAAETTKVIGTVNMAAAQTIGIAAGSAVIGHVIVDTAPTTAVTNQGLTDIDAAIGAVGSAVPANAIATGGTDGTNTVRFYVDPCQRGAHTTQLISLTASATLVTGTAAKNVFICDINIVSASADNVAIVEGTGTVCATGIAGMAGGTTAATGWNFAANGGLTLGNGAASILNTATAADNVCILVSGATQVSGSFHYVKF